MVSSIKKKMRQIFLKISDKLIFNSNFRVIQRIRLLEKKIDIFLNISGLLNEEKLNTIFSQLKILPKSVPQDLVRLGSKNDGGYVLIDKNFKDSLLVSLGIGENLDFELDWLKRGGKVVAFDGTISKIPTRYLSALGSNTDFFWVKKNICMQNDLDSMPINKAIEFARERYPNSEKNSMLKIDIESSEWDAIRDISVANICTFDQVIVELHDLVNLAFFQNEKLNLCLSKLHENFELFWVHENNFSPRFKSNSYLIYDVIETTWINKKSTQFNYASENFIQSRSLDAPNDPMFPNY